MASLPARHAGRQRSQERDEWMSFSRADDAIAMANSNDPFSVVSAIRFLLQMSVNLEQHGNLPESVKCAESALLLRRAKEKLVGHLLKPLIERGMCMHTSAEDAESIVLRCNNYAVAAFNERVFDTAEFFLGKAMFLTDHRSIEDVNYFPAAETRRLMLRASTLNNLGCMEKRRAQLEKSLSYLRQAVEIEVSLDTTSSGSPSTYLNLCTVLNEMNRHQEAVSAAESAIVSLEQQMLRQNKEQLPGCAMMLVIGLYNLGVSLERRGREGDGQKADASYHRALETSRKFFVDPDCPTVELAMAAIRRIHSAPAFRADRLEAKMSPVKMLESDADAHQTNPQTSLPVAAPPSSASGSFLDLKSLPTYAAKTLPQQKRQKQAEARTMSLTAKGPPKVMRLAPLEEVENPGDGAGHCVHPHGSRAPAPLEAMANFPEILSSRRCELGSDFLQSSSAASPKSLPDAALPAKGRQPATESGNGMGSLTASSANSILGKVGAVPHPNPPLQQPLLAPRTFPPRPSQEGMSGVGTFPGTRDLSARPPPLAPMGQIPQRLTKDGSRWLGSNSLVKASPGTRRSLSSSQSALNLFGRRAFGSLSIQEHAASSTSPKLQPPLGESASLAIEKHVKRAQVRQTKMEEAKKKVATSERRGSALVRAREREQKRLAKEEAERDANMADVLYHKFVHGMRAEELNRCRRAAVLIQRIWRGYLARGLLCRMVAAAKRIQRVFRVFLLKLLSLRRAEEEQLARLKVIREKLETEAAISLQARVRLFLRRLEIRRGYFARKMRRHYAARTIQRGFRAFLKWREERIAALMEAQRLEDERLMQLATNAAFRIQWAFSCYLRRKEELRVSQEQQRRERAAATIQALVRGVLARAWFRYYKSYRREQELKSAANQRRIIMLQSAVSVLLAVRHRRAKEFDYMRRAYQHRINKAALMIQCRWRIRVAWFKLERLRAEHDMRNRRASCIQRWYITCVARRKFLEIREANRRRDAAIIIQRWYRDEKERIKEREMARYYADSIRQQRLRLLQEQSVLLLQAWGRGFRSTQIVASMRFSFLRLTLYAEGIQRIGRGYAARRVVCRMKFQAIHAATLRVLHARQTAAAGVLQRAWRCALAKDTVRHMRRREAASVSIAKHYRGYLCRKELRRLREERQLKKETRAAIAMQRAVRRFLQRLEVVRLDKYYRDRHRKKLVAMRREEAVITLQAVWRGRATRMALEREREALAGLSVFAKKIQRAWRARKFRRSINIEVTRRAKTRLGHASAALVIQCFWRKMKAAEDVARLRETCKIRREKAILIQGWWRCILARWVLASLRAQREEELALRLHYMDKWDSMATLINAELRARLAQQHLISRKCKQLIAQLTDRERERFLGRHGAATRIQAVYRGYYERLYARSIRQQRKEEELRRQKREVLERRSAIVIQCAYRVWRAIREAKMRRVAKREKKMEEEIEYYTTIDPHYLVREMFWVHESLLKQDGLKDRVRQSNKRFEASLKIQRAVRQWVARRRVKEIQRRCAETKAVRTIQCYWDRYRTRKHCEALEKQHRAAIIIQTRFRGYHVRQTWVGWRKHKAWEQQQHMLEEHMKDCAATVLQSFWRVVRAKRTARRLRKRQKGRKEWQMLVEAATTIQNAYRHYRLRRAVRTSMM